MEKKQNKYTVSPIEDDGDTIVDLQTIDKRRHVYYECMRIFDKLETTLFNSEDLEQQIRIANVLAKLGHVIVTNEIAESINELRNTIGYVHNGLGEIAGVLDDLGVSVYIHQSENNQELKE